MEIQHLKLSDMYEALAKSCNDFEGQQEGSCFAEDSKLGCPFRIDENGDFLGCGGIDPEHWREVFEGKDEQEPVSLPPFKFGDKVRHNGMPAIFARYSDKSHKTAYILFESGSILPERRVAELKAGWE